MSVLAEVAEIYRRSRKPVDDFWTDYVSRPPAALVVWALRDTSVTPNQVTLASLAVALAAAAAFAAVPGYPGVALGGLLMQASYVVDCADGQLARFKGATTALGAHLDFLMDELKALLLIGAVALRLGLERGQPYWAAGLAGLVAAGWGLAMTTFMRRPEYGAPEAAPRSTAAGIPRTPLGVAEWLGRNVIQYPRYLLIVCLLGKVEWFFWPYLTAHALYAGRASLTIALRVGRPARG